MVQRETWGQRQRLEVFSCLEAHRNVWMSGGAMHSVWNNNPRVVQMWAVVRSDIPRVVQMLAVVSDIPRMV